MRDDEIQSSNSSTVDEPLSPVSQPSTTNSEHKSRSPCLLKLKLQHPQFTTTHTHRRRRTPEEWVENSEERSRRIEGNAWRGLQQPGSTWQAATWAMQHCQNNGFRGSSLQYPTVSSFSFATVSGSFFFHCLVNSSNLT